MQDEGTVQKAQSLLNRLAKNGKLRKLVLLLGFAGIGLLLLSALLPTKTQSVKTVSSLTNSDTNAYTKALEEQIVKVVCAITGETQPSVMVTLYSGTVYSYAADEKSSAVTQEDYASGSKSETRLSSAAETTYILVKNADGSQSALPVCQISPTVQGVVVVSAMAGTATVKENIVRAVTTALGLSSTQVCVVQKSG